MVLKELARSGGLAACSACDVVLFVRRETAAALSPGQELLQNFSQKIGPFAAGLDGLPDSRWFVEERAIGLQLRYMTDLSDWDGLARLRAEIGNIKRQTRTFPNQEKTMGVWADKFRNYKSGPQEKKFIVWWDINPERGLETGLRCEPTATTKPFSRRDQCTTADFLLRPYAWRCRIRNFPGTFLKKYSIFFLRQPRQCAFEDPAARTAGCTHRRG